MVSWGLLTNQNLSPLPPVPWPLDFTRWWLKIRDWQLQSISSFVHMATWDYVVNKKRYIDFFEAYDHQTWEEMTFHPQRYLNFWSREIIHKFAKPHDPLKPEVMWGHLKNKDWYNSTTVEGLLSPVMTSWWFVLQNHHFKVNDPCIKCFYEDMFFCRYISISSRPLATTLGTLMSKIGKNCCSKLIKRYEI